MAAAPMPPGAPMPGTPSPAMPGPDGMPPGAPPAAAGLQPGAMAPQGAPQPPQAPPAPPPKPPVTIDAVMQLLRDDRLRGFRIDVETDQIVEGDEQAEKQRRMEFVTAVGGLLNGAMQLEANPAAGALMPAVGETIMFAVRGFRAGRQLEEVFETALEKAAMLISQPRQAEPDPKAQVQLEGEKIKLQGITIQAQAEERRAQLDIIGKQVEQQDDFERMRLDREKQAAEQSRAERMQAMEERMMLLEHGLKERTHQAEMSRMDREAMQATLVQPGADQMQGGMAGPSDPGAVQGGQPHEMMLGQMAANHAELLAALRAASRPKRIVRDPQTNRVIGVETVPDEA